MRNHGAIGMAIVLLLSSVAPSWAWGRWGWGWGLGATALTVAATAPLWDPYYSYPYSPYYYPYNYPAPYNAPPPYYAGEPYAYPAAPSTTASSEGSTVESSSVNNSRRDLTTIKAQLSHMRDIINYKYDDGDITKAQHDAAIHYLAQIGNLTRSEAAANGGTLAVNQENAILQQIHLADPSIHNPSEPYPEVTPTSANELTEPSIASLPGINSHHDLMAVNDLLLELRTLLDQKVKDGSITQAQHDAEESYLAEIDKQVHADAEANGGALPADEESALVQKLHGAYYSINHNLIVH